MKHIIIAVSPATESTVMLCDSGDKELQRKNVAALLIPQTVNQMCEKENIESITVYGFPKNYIERIAQTIKYQLKKDIKITLEVAGA